MKFLKSIIIILLLFPANAYCVQTVTFSGQYVHRNCMDEVDFRNYFDPITFYINNKKIVIDIEKDALDANMAYFTPENLRTIKKYMLQFIDGKLKSNHKFFDKNNLLIKTTSDDRFSFHHYRKCSYSSGKEFFGFSLSKSSCETFIEGLKLINK